MTTEQKEAGIKTLITREVEIIKTPKGGAPEQVRNKWKGVKFIGVFVPASESFEEDLITKTKTEKRDSYVVRRADAIALLKTKSFEAAKWFSQNVPETVAFFSFGADEVKVTDENPKQTISPEVADAIIEFFIRN